MQLPDESRIVDPGDLTLEDFLPDPPTRKVAAGQPPQIRDTALIDGLAIVPLSHRKDERGWLAELMTTRDQLIEPIVHVYQVAAAPGSIRAWVYHRHQHDRLAYTNGTFELALFDLRRQSPTRGLLNVLRVGWKRPCLLSLPPYVVHGVHNAGTEPASFVNMPTNVYLHDTPDKCRLPYPDPRIPHVFG